MENGFYKVTNGQWLYAPNRVKGSNYELDINKFEDYTYPIDGWVYFPTAPMEYLDYLDSLQVDEFDPFPDNNPIDPDIDPEEGETEPEVIEPPSGNYYKIYDFLSLDTISQKNIRNKYIAPHSLDYKTDLKQRLYPDYTFDNNGFLIEVIYYSECTVTTNGLGMNDYEFINPILKYNAEYTVNSSNYVESRVVTRRWYLLDGTLSEDSKVTKKYYDMISARAEGRTRRKNKISNLLIETVGLIVMTSDDLNSVTDAEADAMNFMKFISPSINEYYEYGDRRDVDNNPCQLIQNVIDSDYVRLNNFVPNTNDTVTIKDYILNKLTT